MTGRVLWAAVVVLALAGCQTGGDKPKALTAAELTARGQIRLESVTTNPNLNASTARQNLRLAIVDFSNAAQADTGNLQARWGLAVAETFAGYHDVRVLVPAFAQSWLEELMLQSAPRGGRAGAETQQAQLRLSSTTITALRSTHDLYTHVLTRVNETGYRPHLRLFYQGGIRNVEFGPADVRLMAAFHDFITALAYAGVAFNLDTANGVVKPLPTDTNANGVLDAGEYLAPEPLLKLYYGNGMSNALVYLQYAATHAVAGAVLEGHTTGARALMDPDDAVMRARLQSLQIDAAFLQQACTQPVTSARYFDQQLHTYDFSRLVKLTTLRDLLPAFAPTHLDAPGIWPDPTFRGLITPGLNQDAIPLTYDEVATMY
jgi:hypothetical protein